MKILDHFEFLSDIRRRKQKEKEKGLRQEEELAWQESELSKEQERLNEICKPKSKSLSEEYGIPDYTP